MKIETILEAAIPNAVDHRMDGYVDMVKSYFGIAPKFRDLRALPADEFDTKYGFQLGKKMFGLIAGITTPHGDIFVREGNEDSALHELVHAAGLGNETMSTFLTEGLTQFATQEIARLHGVKVPDSYDEEVKVAKDIIHKVLAEDPQSFFRRYAKAKDKARWLAHEILKNEANAAAFKSEEDWGPADQIERKLAYELLHMVGVGPMLGQLFDPRF